VRIPGTATPTLGLVSGNGEKELIREDIETLTVTNDGGVDNKGQEKLLIGSSVVRQQSSGVVVADGHIRRTLSDDTANGGGDSKSLEKHDEC
jgi:hypothetical protein